MSAIATKLSSVGMRAQVGTATLAIAAAAAITPAVAHATPSLAPLPQAVGDSAALLIDPVIIEPMVATPGGNKKAAVTAGAAVATDPATIIQTTVDGIAQGIAAFAASVGDYITGWVKVGGSLVYAAVAFTGAAVTAVGDVLPGPIGDAIVGIGDGITSASNAIAQAIHIGPYSTSS